VLGVVDGHQVPVPFNLNSIAALFPPRMADRLCAALVERFGFGRKVPILKLRAEADGDLRFLADYVYERVFEGCTLKQRGMRPEELDPGVTARVPVFVSRDGRYFQDRYQAMPRDGYTAMFRRLLDHPRIDVELGWNGGTPSTPWAMPAPCSPGRSTSISGTPMGGCPIAACASRCGPRHDPPARRWER
jgi:UDP-galactopyranose mutase